MHGNKANRRYKQKNVESPSVPRSLGSSSRGLEEVKGLSLEKFADFLPEVNAFDCDFGLCWLHEVFSLDRSLDACRALDSHHREISYSPKRLACAVRVTRVSRN